MDPWLLRGLCARAMSSERPRKTSTFTVCLWWELGMLGTGLDPRGAKILERSFLIAEACD